MPLQLCRQCLQIPLEPGMKTLCSPEYKGPQRWPLGTFGEMRARNCPFCELVTSICTKSTSFWEPLTPPDDSHTVVVQWNNDRFLTDSSKLGCSVCVSGDSVDKEIYCARAKFDEFIDFGDVRRWLLACEQNHGRLGFECCPTPFNPAILPSIGKRQLDLRLIDVKAMCIIYAPLRCRYLALSYVWGMPHKARLVLTSHNEEALMQPGSLMKAQIPIPTTIMDAITAVRKLGERYLWVDSLCLVQDDASELQACVSLMDLFYEMAVLTIVAADGADAWAGLQGVESTPRQISRLVREISPGLSMTTMTDMDLMLRKSAYATRAWTMQEEVISPRILVFIDGQVFYRCASSYYSEALNWPGKRLHDQTHTVGSTQNLLFEFNDGDYFQSFVHMLMYYKSRKLSYQSDALRAAQGMLRKFSTLTGLHFFEGLPAPLDRSLLFYSSTSNSNSTFGRREGLPSYSWTGWTSGSEYPASASNMRGLSNDKFLDGICNEGEDILRGWIIWHCRLEDGTIFRITDTGRLRKSLFLKPEDSTCKARPRFQEIPVSVSDVEFGIPPVSSYPLLLFWTVCVDLKLRRSTSMNRIYYLALDKYGKYCGAVYKDTATTTEMVNAKFALLTADDDGLWALMLTWKDGVAERRGIAHLSKDVVDVCLPPGPRWKAIVLG